MTFQEKLDAIVERNNSLLCIGLDSSIDRLPEIVKNVEHPQFDFNKEIIDATSHVVCAYKPNSAFYEARGDRGVLELKMTCDYLHSHYPDIPIILDAKRGDIGSTNEGYVQFAFDYLGVDAITIHPYLGKEAIQPFLDRKEKGIIVLCKTSNSGAGEFQDLLVDTEPIYMHVAKRVAHDWNANNNCLLVVGATYPQELEKIRLAVGEMTFLVPGIGVQGGDIEKTVHKGINSKKAGLIINSSRGIIFASKEKDFAQIALDEALKLQTQINSFR